MTAALSGFQHQVPEIFFCPYIIFLKPGGAVLATVIKLCLVPVMRAARNSRLSGRQNKLRFIQIGKINNAPHGGAGGLMVGLMKGISAGIGCFIRAAGTVGTNT